MATKRVFSFLTEQVKRSNKENMSNKRGILICLYHLCAYIKSTISACIESHKFYNRITYGLLSSNEYIKLCKSI
ncbi:hypothetical protein Hanom_Chr10g00884391 [Helianthus anomalus]